MLQLLDPLAGQLQFSVRSLLGLLDKGMNDDEALAEEEAVKGAPNAGAARGRNSNSPSPKALEWGRRRLGPC